MPQFPVFISYRRKLSGSPDKANGLKSAIDGRFGPNHAFVDTSGVESGEDWATKIRETLVAAQVVLVVLQPDWHEARDDRGDRRLLFERDWVRQEITTALTQNQHLIPVLFANDQDACWKDIADWLKEQVPTLQGLLSKEIHPVREASYQQDVESLLARVAQLAKLAPAATPAAVSPAPVPAALLQSRYPLPPSNEWPSAAAEGPYPGLRPFTAENAPLFFGRSAEQLGLLDELHSSSEKLFLLYGYSGVGKSSFLDAGIVPRLQNAGWRVIYYRRNKSEDLSMALRREWAPGATARALLILDQLEEIYTDPRPPGSTEATEAAVFFATLLELLSGPTNAGPKVVLSFRSEHLQQIQDALGRRRYQSFPLAPLPPAGLREAILGVQEDATLRNYYGFDWEAGLPDFLVREVRRDPVAPATPLLQFTLRYLWDCLPPSAAGKRTFTRAHYDEHTHQGARTTLDALLDTQLEALVQDEPTLDEHATSGLLLELLHAYTTERATAATQFDQALDARFAHLEPGVLPNLRQALCRKYLLLKEDADCCRLAHDALAPLVRWRHQQSVAPGQRAWLLLQSKARELELEQTAPVQLTLADLALVEAGRRGMPQLPAELEDFLAREQARFTAEQAAQAAQEQRFIAAKAEFLDVQLELADKELGILRYEAAWTALQRAQTTGQGREAIAWRLPELAYWFGETQRPQQALEILRAWPHWSSDRQQADLRAAAPNRALIRQLLAEVPVPPERLQGAAAIYHPFQQHATAFFDACYYPAATQVRVAGGSWQRGIRTAESDDDEGPEHTVQLGNFSLGAAPLTYRQWALYRQATQQSWQLPSWSNEVPIAEHPALYLDWYEALEAANWFSVQEGLGQVYDIRKEERDEDNSANNDYKKYRVLVDATANGYRLPTEAEWEYAARGGPRQDPYPYAGSADADAVAWSWRNSGREQHQRPDEEWNLDWVFNNASRTHSVAGLQPNGLGLYDLSGNVWEWCWDWYAADYYTQLAEQGKAVSNPVGPPGGDRRVVRGGAWSFPMNACRLAYRDRDVAVNRNNNSGCRLARTV